MKSKPGTYTLVLRSDARAKVRIGRWGHLDIEPGYYLYVGSAFGPGGVLARVLRHCRPAKARHWHIDYLREFVTPVLAWYSHKRSHLEHRWAQAMARMTGIKPIQGFGCSDCGCMTHLFHTAAPPDSAAFTHAVGGPVETWICPAAGERIAPLRE